jgi:hypothetical protein
MWSRLWPPEPDPSRLSPPGFQKETSHCRKITHCFHIRLHHDQAWHPSGMPAPMLGQVDSYSYPGYPGAWGGHLQEFQGRDGPPGPNQRQDTTMASYSQPYGMGMGPTYTTHPEMPAGMRAQPEGPPEGISLPEGAGGEWQQQRRRVSHAQPPQGPHATNATRQAFGPGDGQPRPGRYSMLRPFLESTQFHPHRADPAPRATAMFQASQLEQASGAPRPRQTSLSGAFGGFEARSLDEATVHIVERALSGTLTYSRHAPPRPKVIRPAIAPPAGL